MPPEGSFAAKKWLGGNMHMCLKALAAILSLGLACSGPAAAQNWPSRPINMIVPFPAGGATDTLARFLGGQMRPVLGQPIVIENVAGAGGTNRVCGAARPP